MDLVTRERVLELLRRHGWNTTSFQVLEPDFSYWFDGDDACVAYVDTGGAWVVAGGPLAPEERLGEVAQRFTAAARAHGRRAAFFAVEQRLLDALPLEATPIGELPLWDPRQWSERHRGHRSLREQLRRARAKGVTVTRVDDPGPVRGELERLIGRWLGSRSMPAMAFLVELHPFVFESERRYYVARVRGEVRGLLVAVPVYLRRGWFFEDVLRDPAAPNGTVEMLVDFAMRDVAGDGAEIVTLGLAPLAGASRAMRLVRRAMRGFYNFEGLRAFKAKFRPDAWEPIYLARPRGRTAIGALYDALSAFARGRPFRFAAAAVLRAPKIVLAALATLLVPWMIVLTLAPSWFPSRGVQLAWIVADVALATGLFALSRRWRRGLVVALSVATALDAMLTLAQAVAHGGPPIIALSAAAPALVTAILIGGLRAHRDVDRVPAR